MQKTSINGELIAYEEIGEGLPIICIHPPGMGRKVFYEQKPLSKHFRLIIPDLIGHGDSTYSRHTEITIQRFSEDIISLMDFLGLTSTVIFGYSAGATIAQYLCIHYPSRVKALIMSGGYPIVDNFILINEHRLGILTVEKNKNLLSTVLAHSHTKDKDYRMILKAHMNKSNSQVWSQFYLQSLHFNCKNQINGLAIPTLLLYGGRADAMNTYIKFYKTALMNKQVYIIKGATHQLPTKEPKRVNQLITGFLLH